MGRLLCILFACLALVLPGCASLGRSNPEATGVIFKSVTISGQSHRYAVYVPREYDGSRAWPLIVFLHGRGECGTDGSAQVAVGLGPALMLKPERWPAIILMPQKPTQQSGWEDHDAMVMAQLDATRREYSIDASRIYLTGLSQGGRGTWHLAARHPDLFAAIAPVCGFGDAGALAPKVAHYPIWAFHGLRDAVILPEQTTTMIQAIRQARGGTSTEERAEEKNGVTTTFVSAGELSAEVSKRPELRMTLYTTLEHNCWDAAYRESGLAEWLFRNRREPGLVRKVTDGTSPKIP